MDKKSSNPIKLDDEKGLMDFLRQPTIKIAEFLTGILISDQKDWKLSAGHLVQAVIKGNFLTQLGREIDGYRKEGKIKEDYFADSKNRASLNELLKFIDEAPEEDLFNAAKSVFLRSITIDATEKDQILAYEFLQTIKKLSGTEILILKANFEISKKDFIGKDEITDRGAWSTYITDEMKFHNLTSIIDKYENNLISLGLISVKVANDSSGFRKTQHFRLTEMGYKFCEFIEKYD